MDPLITYMVRMTSAINMTYILMGDSDIMNGTFDPGVFLLVNVCLSRALSPTG